jgi:hypothetical protein
MYEADTCVWDLVFPFSPSYVKYSAVLDIRGPAYLAARIRHSSVKPNPVFDAIFAVLIISDCCYKSKKSETRVAPVPLGILFCREKDIFFIFD